MCGIAGLLSRRLDGRAIVARMTDAQAHRGPDDSGLASFATPSGSLVFGHRRLSIVDLSPAGHQPMVDERTGNAIVYNGEIYNASEVRAELARDGAAFVGHSDTEVLLQAFARWGIGALDRLYGMYAFALFAPREQRLYLARDPFGIKPLYYAAAPHGEIAFASELRGVVPSGIVSSDFDRDALASFFAYGAIASPLTILRDVRQLPAGCFGVVDLGASTPSALRIEPHWTFPKHVSAASTEAIAEELAPQLRAAVASHFVSDVPVGIFLSRGVDSVAIAATAAEAKLDIDAFTVALEEAPQLDEARAAGEIARSLGLRHHVVHLGESEARELVPEWLALVDQPTIDGVNTYAISKAVRARGMTVALSGLGGDEIFGGYPSFRTVPALSRFAPMVRHVPRGARGAVVSALTTGWLGAVQRRKALDFATATPDARTYALQRRRLFSNEQIAALGLGEATRDTAFLPFESARALDVYPESAWATVRSVESRIYMGDMLLRDADVFGMASSLEIRVPLLDRRIVDIALRYALAPRSTLSRAPKKEWLVAALGDKLPRVVSRLPKRGFTLPIAQWMTGPLRPLCEERALDDHGLVPRAAAAAAWNELLASGSSQAYSRALAFVALAESASRLRRAVAESRRARAAA